MPSVRKPRRGSLQFWPRVRARRIYPRVRTWRVVSDAKPLGFAGYKLGMTHVFFTDDRANSPTKGENIAVPVTVLECPPLKVAGIVGYAHAKEGYGTQSCGIVWAE